MLAIELSASAPEKSFVGRGRASRGTVCGDGGQWYTRFEPFADDVTSRMHSSVSLIFYYP